MNFTHNPFECGLDAFIDLDADIESMSLPALRKMQGKHENQLVGIVFDEPMSIEGYAIFSGDRQVGDIRSQVWSPRYKKHLFMVMMKRDFLADNTSVEINGKMGAIVDLPFDFKAIA